MKSDDWGSCPLTRVSAACRQGYVVDLLFLLAYGTNAQPKVCGNKYSGRHERGLRYSSIRGLEWKGTAAP